MAFYDSEMDARNAATLQNAAPDAIGGIDTAATDSQPDGANAQSQQKGVGGHSHPEGAITRDNPEGAIAHTDPEGAIAYTHAEGVQAYAPAYLFLFSSVFQGEPKLIAKVAKYLLFDTGANIYITNSNRDFLLNTVVNIFKKHFTI